MADRPLSYAEFWPYYLREHADPRTRLVHYLGSALALSALAAAAITLDWHWLVAALMFAALPLAWAMTSLPRTAPDRELLFTVHKSIGVTILALMAVRLMLRTTRPIPAEPAGMPRWMAGCAVASHWMLYAVLFIMPISGYVLSSAGGNPVSYFGLFTLLNGERDVQVRSRHHAGSGSSRT